MLVKDYPNAAESLAHACHFLASQYGETGVECADAYFHYGISLLEIVRMEQDAVENDKPSEDKSLENADPSYLERAWEVLQLTKKIYSKLASTPTDPSTHAENTRRFCDTLFALGEVNIKNKDYSQAIKDLSACLEKRKDELPKEKREIAITQYQLGVVLEYHAAQQFDEVVKYFKDGRMVEVDVAPSSPVVAVANKKQIIAVDHVMEGKRYMLVRDFPNAAESLSLIHI